MSPSPARRWKCRWDKVLLREAGFGNGPVDATFAAIRNITKTNYPLLKYAVNAITGGSDAMGEVTFNSNITDIPLSAAALIPMSSSPRPKLILTP